MPELPEVEAARVLVHNHCKGKIISNAIAADDTSTLECVFGTLLAWPSLCLIKAYLSACRGDRGCQPGRIAEKSIKKVNCRSSP
jgi:hypothetical protein